jgi:nucleoside-diphosphate-sugar epimerase
VLLDEKKTQIQAIPIRLIMSNSQFKTVTIAGGTGTLGYAVSEAFLNDGSYKVKILRRKPENENEKAKLLASKGAEIVYADYNQKDELVNALKGTDVLISAICIDKKEAIKGFGDIQYPLLAAAKEASVKRFIPSEFGVAYQCVFFFYYYIFAAYRKYSIIFYIDLFFFFVN